MLTRLHAALMALFAAVLFLSASVAGGGAVLAAETPAKPAQTKVVPIPPLPAGQLPSADFWRRIKENARGRVAGPPSNPPWLILHVSKDGKCIRDGTCPERLVGFSMPIWQKMPPVRPIVGRGPTIHELYFIAAVVSVLLLALLLFVSFRLGRRDEEGARGQGA